MNNSSGTMPYIKSEPDDFGNNPNRFMRASQFQNYGNQFNNHQDGASIDPSELSMQNNYGMNYNFGATNMSSSFSMGNSGYDDSELLDGLDFGNAQGGMLDDFSGVPQPNNNNRNSGAIPMNQEVYSSTPDGHPIQSPFLGNFDYSQFRPMNSIPQHMSPMSASQFAKRPSMQAANRKSSDQRSPLTPRTAAMAGLHIGTPESSSVVNVRPIRAPSVPNRHSHSKNLSGQYDSTPGSLHSYLDSPLSSPGGAMQHAGISETIGSGHHASLPAKVENGLSTNPSENAEAKKRRRRASHNAVERRRRDNINERIQDLSHLVPQHRLDDDKVKKQLQNTGPLSPSLGATSMSPPTAGNAAASILAGPGRRTAGNITIGLPLDEKEKGPNKGDILNGSVSWTRDLMWALYQKYQQDDELAQYIIGLGGSWPFQITDDEKRMRSEVMDAMEKNDPTSFAYSRADGTGLRVPRHTNVAGDRIQANSSLSPQSNFELSPGFHSGGSGTNSGSNTGQPQYWHSAGHGGISFKEEDEFMEMN